jgi:AcrR family transcriptional regulator
MAGEGGLRERKREATRRRIAEEGLRLFLAGGYEATTLDAVAAAAGISRRTFFSYFASKDEILMALNEAFWETILADLARAIPGGPPLDAVRDVLVRHVSRYTGDEMQALDRLMRSSPALLASKPAAYARQERAMFEVLRRVWPAPGREEGLRVVAMLSVGAVRLAIDAWHRAGGDRSPAAYVTEVFESLRAEVEAGDDAEPPRGANPKRPGGKRTG